MKLDEFHARLISEANEFYEAYKSHKGDANWPDDMSEGEWWEQFYTFQSGGEE